MKQENIEDIYELSPMQQGMLFHTLAAPNSGVYFEQFCYTLQTQLNVSAFLKAWQRVLARHPILRTSFYWKNLDKPYQVVYRQVDLPWEFLDWRKLSLQEQQRQLEAFLKADRERGFELSLAPLIRLVLFQVTDDTYQFVFSFHHILMEGWSLTWLWKEFYGFYHAFSQSQDLHLERPRPYREYIAWLQQQDLSKAEAFWRETLKGFTVPTPLVMAKASGSNSCQDEDYDRQHTQLSATFSAALKSFAQKHQLTLNILLKGAWALLLSRYSTESDVVFGATSSGRPAALAEAESMVGLFINTLPLRVQVHNDDFLLPWLKKLQAQEVQMRQYEYSSLIQIQQWSEIPRGQPLFESLLVFNNYLVDSTQDKLAQSMRSSKYWSFEKTNYPLTVVVGTSLELSIIIAYDTHRFDSSIISRMLGHLKTLLEAIVANPAWRLRDLPLLTAQESYQLLIEWNDTQVKYPRQQSIHQLFEAQVELTPDAIAVVFEDQQLSYCELNARANQLGHHLHSLGVEPEVLVGICVERSSFGAVALTLDMVIGLLGILKAGGAYVPLDPAYPPERLAFILQNAQITVLLTQQHLMENFPEFQTRTICLDTDWGSIAKESQHNFMSECTTDNLAYIIYTSGSTGQPKGVLVNHANVVRLLAATQSWYNFNQQDVFSLFHSIAFDFSVWELWGALLYGGRLVIVPYWLSRSPQEFYKFLLQQQVTVLNQTPSAFRQLIQAEELLECVQQLNLRLVIFGGEALELQSLKPWFERHGDQSPQLVNMYGITETTVHVTYKPLTVADLNLGLGSVIGRPIPDLQVYVLDQHQQPVPIGVPGEMYIGGAGLARGYLNRPDLTCHSFIPNPFSSEPSARLYRSGDLGRYLPNGDIEYLGRIDHQVKIRGFRIELGEIEAVLAQHPAVLETVVLARETQPSEKQLVAYVVKSKEQIPTTNELRNFLREKLPEYMLPVVFVFLDALPLTPNGKVNRKALPAPNATQLLSESNFAAPATPIEQMLAGIWAEVLGLEKVGLHNNFFELGGHSLLATRVISRVQQVFQQELPLHRLFEQPTIARLAREIEKVTQDSLGVETKTIERISRSQELPLSFAQQRLWFLAQLEPNNPFYNIPAAVRLEGQLNLSALQQSFNEILRRHEALRTNFQTLEGQPVAIISSVTSLPLLIIDISELASNQQQASVRKLVDKEAQRLFNLNSDLLLRVKLLRLREQEHIVLLTMHHIAYDGWSTSVLVRELATLYQAFYEQQPSPLAELPIQYVDFAAWQGQWLQTEILQFQIAYWKKQLEGAPTVLELPTDYPRAAVQTFRGATHLFELSVELSQAINKLSQQEGCTLFMTLLAAFTILLSCYSGQEDIVVGSPIANRNRVELEGLIGLFLNTLALRTDLSGDPTFLELLTRVRQVTLGAYSHKDLPFEKLVQELAPKRNLRYSPLFQVWFALQNVPTTKLKLPGLTLSLLEIDNTTVQFDLELFVSEGVEGLSACFKYNTDLFNATTIAQMANHFEILLLDIVEQPNTRLKALAERLTEADSQQALVTAKEFKKADLQMLKNIKRNRHQEK